MVLVQNIMKQLYTIMQKIINTILTGILDNQLENAQTAKTILPNFT